MTVEDNGEPCRNITETFGMDGTVQPRGKDESRAAPPFPLSLRRAATLLRQLTEHVSKPRDHDRVQIMIETNSLQPNLPPPSIQIRLEPKISTENLVEVMDRRLNLKIYDGSSELAI